MKIIGVRGNAALRERKKTLFLCSKHAPIECYEPVFRWVESLTPRDCVMCFNSTEMEEEVLRSLLVHGIPVVLFVMNRFRDENNLQIQRALNEGRILIIELRRDEPQGMGATPRLRNQFVMGLAQHIVCGYINKNGSIYPILAGKENVDFLLGENVTVAAEQEPLNYRWTVAEDKMLLRMFYVDMGMHEIRKRTGRSYEAIRQRLRAITMPEDVLKGREFEDYVLELFDLQHNPALTLKEWQSDKTLGEICPEGNQNPDFVFACDGQQFAIECKWRSCIPRDMERNLFPQEKLTTYQRFAQSRRVPVFIVLGIGGEPCEPESLYVIPLPDVPSVVCKKKGLSQFVRLSTTDTFRIGEFITDKDTKGTKRPKSPAYSMADIRTKHPNAYRPWTKEDDDKLMRLYNEGTGIVALSQIFGRQRSAISSRIRKLTEV